MKNDNINELFEDLDFNNAEPKTGHRERFLEKLEASANQGSRWQPQVRNLWGPFIGIAASITLAILVFGNVFTNASASNKGELASVSTEMKETQDFYTSVIQRELNTIKDEKSPETEAIVNDALQQMQKLESEYTKLKEDLVNSGNDNRVIYAMISNFQKRIDLLNTVLVQIENIKSLKSQSHESTII